MALNALTVQWVLSKGAPAHSLREVQLPLHRVASPAFYIAKKADMVGGRLSSHDRCLGWRTSWQAEAAVLAVVLVNTKTRR